MLAALLAILHGMLDTFRSRHELTVENLALRQQLAICHRTVPRPKIRPSDSFFRVTLQHLSTAACSCACLGFFRVTLQRLWSGWRDALVVVKPGTVISMRSTATGDGASATRSRPARTFPGRRGVDGQTDLD